jgi:hypothetical protein
MKSCYLVEHTIQWTKEFETAPITQERKKETARETNRLSEFIVVTELSIIIVIIIFFFLLIFVPILFFLI